MFDFPPEIRGKIISPGTHLKLMSLYPHEASDHLKIIRMRTDPSWAQPRRIHEKRKNLPIAHQRIFLNDKVRKTRYCLPSRISQTTKYGKLGVANGPGSPIRQNTENWILHTDKDLPSDKLRKILSCEPSSICQTTKYG